MDDLLVFFAENVGWAWIVAGIILLIGEMVLPGIFLMWIGIASLMTGLFAFIFTDLGAGTYSAYFTVSAVISVYFGNRFFYGPRGTPADNALNQSGQQFVGRICVVETAIENGRGAVKLGDGRWIAEGPDAPIGTKVKVIAVDGIVLTVEPTEG